MWLYVICLRAWKFSVCLSVFVFRFLFVSVAAANCNEGKMQMIKYSVRKWNQNQLAKTQHKEGKANAMISYGVSFQNIQSEVSTLRRSSVGFFFSNFYLFTF